MKHLLLFLAAFAFCTLPARADDAPAAPPVPAPAPVSADTGKAPVARKEEDDAAPADAPAAAAAGREGFFTRIFSSKKTAEDTAAVAVLDSLKSENATLKSSIAALEAENAEQKKQLSYFDDNWPAIEAALSAGNSAAPALQTALGSRIAAAVATGTQAAIIGAAHSPAKLPGPGANDPDTGDKPEATAKPGTPAAVSAAMRAGWAAKGYTPPGLN